MLEIFCNSDSFGGAETFSQLLLDNFESRIWTTEKLKNKFNGNANSLDLGKKISKRSYDFYRFTKYRKKIHESITLNDSLLFTQFKKEQILIGNNSFARYKRFTFEHGPLHTLLKIHPLLRLQYKTALKNYNKRFCGALLTKHSLERDLDLEFTHIPYGINYSPSISEDEREKKRQALGVPRDAIVLCFADRPTKERGFFDLMKLLEESEFPFHFWIFGSNNIHLSTSNNVRFFGFDPKLNDYLALSDYFLNLSTAEGEAFPLRILQALLKGNGIISCDGLFREEMEQMQPFEHVLPRIRGPKFRSHLKYVLNSINSQIEKDKRQSKNQKIKENHSTEVMIQRLSNEMGIKAL